MKDVSIFDGVVVFEAEGLTYQAIWRESLWEMAAMVQARVMETHEIRAPSATSPGVLLTAWWKAQKKAGTYRAGTEST